MLDIQHRKGDSMSEVVRTALVGGIFTLLGAIAGAGIAGWSQVELAKQKFNSDLVLKALESGSPEQRLGTLRLLVETNLLKDPEIQNGVRSYVENKKNNPESIPQVIQSGNLGKPIIGNSRVFLLAGGKPKDALFASYKTQLENAGYKVLGAKVITDPGRQNNEEVRYFNQEDKEQAEKIAEFLKFSLNLRSLDANFWPDATAKQGYIEIWFGK
jgi:hypothetical protein